jgi:hypothetical protein
MKIEVTANLDLDEIGYQLVEQLSEKQFVDWIFETIDRMTEQEEVIARMRKTLKQYDEPESSKQEYSKPETKKERMKKCPGKSESFCDEMLRISGR